MLSFVLAWAAATVPADVPERAPRLPPPRGRVVRVSDEAGLQRALDGLSDDTTILLARGEYRLTSTLHLGRGRGVSNVALRGETGRFEDVVLLGEGMGADTSSVPHGIAVHDVDDFLLADLSIGEVRLHGVAIQPENGCRGVRLYHCRIFNTGEQLVKANPAREGAFLEACVVEYCVLSYEEEGPTNGYTNGVDVHGGREWVLRHNRFRNIRVPPDEEYRAVPAVLVWNGSRGTLCEANTFLDCERAIAFGLVERDGRHDHQGGAIRNNFIAVSPAGTHHTDAGIVVNDSPGTQVLHNTVLLSGGYANAIECRFRGTQGALVAHNLTDAQIVLRDGAEATVEGNLTRAAPNLFVAPERGDLHLRAEIDRAAVRADCPDDFDGRRRSRWTSAGAHERRR